MKTIGLDGTYIDYFNTVHGFGIRVLEDRCFVVIQIEGGQPVFGHPHQIPLQLEIVPSHVRMVIDNHVLNYPASDLIDVMIGKKSFQQALESQTKREPKWMTAQDARQTTTIKSDGWSLTTSQLQPRLCTQPASSPREAVMKCPPPILKNC